MRERVRQRINERIQMHGDEAMQCNTRTSNDVDDISFFVSECSDQSSFDLMFCCSGDKNKSEHKKQIKRRKRMSCKIT